MRARRPIDVAQVLAPIAPGSCDAPDADVLAAWFAERGAGERGRESEARHREAEAHRIDVTLVMKARDDVADVGLADPDLGRDLVESEGATFGLSARQDDDDVGGNGLVVERGHEKFPWD